MSTQDKIKDMKISSPTATVSASPTPEMEFLGLQSQEFRDLYAFYRELLPNGLSQKELTVSLAARIADSYGLPSSASSKIASIVLSAFSSPSFSSLFLDCDDCGRGSSPISAPGAVSDSPSFPIRPNHAFILQSDAAAFRSLTSVDPHSSPELRCLLLSFLISYRRNWHPKGWVRYDRRAIMYMAGLSSASSKKQESLTSYLHQEYGLDMQVIGSNSPIPCFLFPWAKEHPESPANPRIDLGPCSPASVSSAVASLLS